VTRPLLTLTKLGAGRWPTLHGYELKGEPHPKDVERTYTFASQDTSDGTTKMLSRPNIKLTWDNLYVLKYQSAHAGAFVRRNDRLAPKNHTSIAKPNDNDWDTNPAFVYQTELVSFNTPVVPLIRAGVIEEDPLSSTEHAVWQMLATFRTNPNTPEDEGANTNSIKLEVSVDHSFELLQDRADTIRPRQPVFLLQATLEQGEGKAQSGADGENVYQHDEDAAHEIAQEISKWHTVNAVDAAKPALGFSWTLFATRITGDGNLLPLVRIDRAVVRPNGLEWWRV
jgi:hypothetical protein